MPPVGLPADFVATPYGAKVLDDEVAQVRSAPKGVRNKTLNDAAFKVGQLVAGGQIPRDDARAVLMRAALDAGLSEHETNATLSSGLSAGFQSPRVPEPRAPEGPAVDLSAVTTRAAQMAHGPSIEIVAAGPGGHDNDDDADDMADVPIDPAPLPDAFYRVPGFIAGVMGFTLDCAPIPNPVLAFCGALAPQAHLAGRKVRDSSDIRTNLYLIALADSTSGKDFPRKVNARILHEIGAARQCATQFATGEGLQDSLYIEPAMLCQTDEIASMFIPLAPSKDARHEAAMQERLSLYTSADNFYAMRKKAGQDKNARYGKSTSRTSRSWDPRPPTNATRRSPPGCGATACSGGC